MPSSSALGGWMSKAVLGPPCPSSVCTSRPHSHPNIQPHTLPLYTGGKIAAKNGRKQNQRTRQVGRDLWSYSSPALRKAELTPNSGQVFPSDVVFCSVRVLAEGGREGGGHPWDGKESGDEGTSRPPCRRGASAGYGLTPCRCPPRQSLPAPEVSELQSH